MLSDGVGRIELVDCLWRPASVREALFVRRFAEYFSWIPGSVDSGRHLLGLDFRRHYSVLALAPALRLERRWQLLLMVSD